MHKPTTQQVLGFIATVCIIIFLTSLVATLGEEPQPAPRTMTPYEQCQLYNKFAEWPYAGNCPGDLQPRWYVG